MLPEDEERLAELESCGEIYEGQIQPYTKLKLEQFAERFQLDTIRTDIKTQQKEANETSAHRFAELAAEIHRLRLEVQASMNTPPSSVVSSTLLTDPTSSPAARPLFSPGRRILPSFWAYGNGYSECTSIGYSAYGTDFSDRIYSPIIREVYNFLVDLEREFRLRNYELGLPADSTEGWARYAVMQLEGWAKTWAAFEWGADPNITWGTFRKSVIGQFVPESAVKELRNQYNELDCIMLTDHLGRPPRGFYGVNNGSIKVLNNNFRQLRILLMFSGKDISEEEAIQDYVKKIAGNNEVSVAFSQYVTFRRVVERDSAEMGLEEVMKYCENLDEKNRTACN